MSPIALRMHAQCCCYFITKYGPVLHIIKLAKYSVKRIKSLRCNGYLLLSNEMLKITLIHVSYPVREQYNVSTLIITFLSKYSVAAGLFLNWGNWLI